MTRATIIVDNNTLKLVCATSLVNSDDDNTKSLLHEAGSLLARQWPRGGTKQEYIQKMTSNSHGFPASYVFVKVKQSSLDNVGNEMKTSVNKNNACTAAYDSIEQQQQQQQQSYELIGHGRLNECYESLAGNAAAATYIVIHEKYRTMGYGRQLMTLLEEEAKVLGYHYMYLWTNTATEFYKKLQYQETERVSLHRACLKPLQCDEVNRLEDMLRGKITSMMIKTNKNNISEKVASSNAMKLQENKQQEQSPCMQRKNLQTETVLLPPTGHSNNNDEDDNNPPKEDDVWLRKRLVECIDACSKVISIDDRIQEIKEGIIDYRWRRQRQHQQQNQSNPNNDNHKNCDDNDHITATATCYYEWRYHYVPVPWQQQIGPSCGLAALRMVRDYYYYHHTDTNNTMLMMPSLLKEAIQLGYTNDGEIFDANNLVQLGRNVCGLDLTMHSFCQTSIHDMVRMIHGDDCCGSNTDHPTNGTTTTTTTTTNNKNKEGGILILPYDTNKRTKLPCNKSNGMNAHYGVIVGIVFGSSIAKEQPPIRKERSKQNLNDVSNETDEAIIYDTIVDGWLDSTGGYVNNTNDYDDILLLVQHGLSSKLSIASWEEFVSSNQQLTTYDHAKYKHVTNLCLQDCLIQCHGVL